jgi:UDP-N-acetylglucosamine 2-epimerase
VKIATVVGARPQFVKAAPVSVELRKRAQEVLVHTGQHYDEEMSAVFFETLRLPEPDYHLGVGSASHGRQTGAMLSRIEEVLEKEAPDRVLVYGDTNSTVAGALAAAKLQIPVGHVEAGLRSHNRTMPEELNRVVTDHLATLLFCPTRTAVENLRLEGIGHGVHLVGDVMYDLALVSAQAAGKRTIRSELQLAAKSYVLATVHRAGTVDSREALAGILRAFTRSALPIVFPVHPRTRQRIEAFGLGGLVGPNVRMIRPVDYLDFLALLIDAAKVATDSGGVQKEAYFFGVPCITLRGETEWVETEEDGWNFLAGTDEADILEALRTFSPSGTKGVSFGDGHAAEKIADLVTGT